jgi:hypothetical protein
MGSTRPSLARGRHAFAAPLALCAALAAHAAEPAPRAMQPLADDELASVRGSDGLAFNLSGFSLAGSLKLTYTQPGPAANTLWVGNISLSRSDDPSATFSDPYTLRVLSRGTGLGDMIRLTEPANASGLLKWQLAADWGTTADGIDFQGGALIVKDLVTRGGSLTLAPPLAAGVEGIGFGLALQADIGHVILRPRGRDDVTNADPSTVSEQFRLSGIKLGAASDTGVALGTPWVIADATNQPGLFNAITDSNGNSFLHLNIGWPTTPAGAPFGTLGIDSIVFKSDALPGGSLDLGSSRIGTLQIQYLDVKLKAGF